MPDDQEKNDAGQESSSNNNKGEPVPNVPSREEAEARQEGKWNAFCKVAKVVGLSTISLGVYLIFRKKL